MNRQAVSTSPAPDVYIDEVQGELQVKGWDQDEVEVKAVQDDLELEEQDDVVHLRCRGNCAVRLPSGATVKVGQIGGEARFKLLEDQLQIESIQGSLILKNVGETQIGVIHGNLVARSVQGDLAAEDIRGNATVRGIQGQCTLDEVGGNAEVRDVDGSLQVRAHGNAWVRLSGLEGDDYEIQAHGNAFCRIPQDADVSLRLSSGAQNIRLKLPGGSQDARQAYLETTLGSGSIPMQVSAGGNLSLSADEDADLEGEAGGMTGDEDFSPFEQDFTRQIEIQIEAQVEAMTRRINEQLSRLTDQMGRMDISDEEAEDIMQQARTSGERAAARAQERMRKAQERLERKLENTRRRNEIKAKAADRRSRRSWSFEFPSPPAPPSPPVAEPVSDEERLIILRMLEQKKISLEEAEALLASLEGRES